MARGKESLPASASIDFRYHSISDMPWEKIEKAVDKEFSEKEKSEIFHCSQAFDWEFCSLSKAPSLSEVDNLRSSLLKHCRAIADLEQRFPALQIKTNEVRPDVASAMEIYFGTKEFKFRDTYEAVARMSEAICRGLEERPKLQDVTVAGTPETAGLRMFLARVLEDADKFRARGSPEGSFASEGYEYRRWGLSIGPRARRFPQFVSAVLNRDVTEGTLRKVWPSVPGKLG